MWNQVFPASGLLLAFLDLAKFPSFLLRKRLKIALLLYEKVLLTKCSSTYHSLHLLICFSLVSCLIGVVFFFAMIFNSGFFCLTFQESL